MANFELKGVAERQASLHAHPIYEEVRTLEDLRVFMAHHVYAVWDFMSLLKSLQQRIAPAAVPWLPGEDTLLRRFINDIVLAEESDEGLAANGGTPTFVSHFELYLMAMREVGADTGPVESFLKAVAKKGVPAALGRRNLPVPAKNFVATTFDFLESDKPHVVAAAFALGREEVIPSMFRALLEKLGVSKQKAPLFHYYLERHIHLDDEFHGPLSMRLLQHLCDDSTKKQRTAAKAACRAIDARLEFWDGVRVALPSYSKKRAK